MKDPGFPALGLVPFPHPPERRKRRTWGCKDVEEQRGRRGRVKRGGVRPAAARAKEGRMERPAARPAGVRRIEAVAAEGGSRVPGVRERREAWAAVGAQEAAAPAALGREGRGRWSRGGHFCTGGSEGWVRCRAGRGGLDPPAVGAGRGRGRPGPPGERLLLRRRRRGSRLLPAGGASGGCSPARLGSRVVAAKPPAPLPPRRDELPER